MSNEAFDKVIELLQPISVKLDALSAEVATIKSSLVSKDFLEGELRNQKLAFEDEIKNQNEKIQALANDLNDHKLALSDLKRAVDNFLSASDKESDFESVNSAPISPRVKIKKKLIVIGDSIVKHIDVKRICPGEDCLLICIRGARVGDIRRKLYQISSDFEADHLIIVVGANHHSENSMALSGKFKSLLSDAKELFNGSKIHYSGNLPKISDDFVPCTVGLK